MARSNIRQNMPNMAKYVFWCIFGRAKYGKVLKLEIVHKEAGGCHGSSVSPSLIDVGIELLWQIKRAETD